MNHSPASLDRLAFTATLHCFTGCAIGEAVGLAIATAAGWGNLASVLLAIAFAFAFGYAFTTYPLVRSGMSLRRAGRLALAADTVSIAVMETVDNTLVAAIPGAMAAGLGDGLFWWTLALGLFVAFWVAYPLNRRLISGGAGHAVVHGHH